MHLYQELDESYYLTEDFNGASGHMLHILGSTTLAELTAITGYEEAVQIYRAMQGKPSTIEVFI